MIDDETRKGFTDFAENRFALRQILREAGFSQAEAMQLICVPQVQVNGQPMSPDMEQLVSRMTRAFEEDLDD